MYKWDDLVPVSFAAGIIQTLFYGDFIYYFIRSNQNERIINLPIWYICTAKHSKLYPLSYIRVLYRVKWSQRNALGKCLFQLLFSMFLANIDTLYIEKLFCLGVCRLKFEFVQTEDLFHHLIAQTDDDAPIVFNGFNKICIFFPLFLLLDLCYWVLKHSCLWLNSPAVIKQKANIVSELFRRT